MKQWKHILKWGVILSLACLTASSQLPQYAEPLEASVRIKTARGTGSGTVVFCEQLTNGFYHSHVWTAAHLFVNELEQPTVELFDGNSVEEIPFHIDEIKRDIDFAVLCSQRLTHPMAPVAVHEMDDFYVTHSAGDHITVVGCGLGHRPYPKSGTLNWTNLPTGPWNSLFIAYSTPTIFGDSGGGVFDSRGRLIAIVSHISLLRGYGTPYEHVGYGVPVTLIGQGPEKCSAIRP